MSPETVEAERVPTQCNSRVGGGTDAGRITQANVLARGREIEIELLVEVSGVAFEVERAASGARGESLDVNAIASEKKRAVEFAQAAGQSGIGERSRWPLADCPEARGSARVPPTVRFIVTQTGRREVGIEAGEQFEIEAAIGGEIESARAGELHGAVRGEVSSLPQQMELLNVDRLIARARSEWDPDCGASHFRRRGRARSELPARVHCAGLAKRASEDRESRRRRNGP